MLGLYSFSILFGLELISALKAIGKDVDVESERLLWLFIAPYKLTLTFHSNVKEDVA